MIKKGDAVYIRVLGSGAGGGFPQWNCNCENCAGVRSGSIKAKARTQSSIAVSSDKVNWLLVNASPDILTQLQRNPELEPRGSTLRNTGIRAVALIDAQIDHVTGLLMLRESTVPLELHATQAVQNDLKTGLPIIPLLSHYAGLDIRTIGLDGTALQLPEELKFKVRPLVIHSKPPPFSPNREHPIPGDNIGLIIENPVSGKTVFYAPGLGDMDDNALKAMEASDILLVDGTFWTEDEMIVKGLATKPAASMGHLPQAGKGGMIEVMNALPAGKRKVLIHINNTNPILREDSAERATLDKNGIEAAYDGMEIEF